MLDDRPRRRRRPMEQNNTPRVTFSASPTLEQVYSLLQANNALLLMINVRLERLEQQAS